MWKGDLYFDTELKVYDALETPTVTQGAWSTMKSIGSTIGKWRSSNSDVGGNMEGALTSKRLGAEVVISPNKGGEIVLLHIEEVIGSHAAPKDVLAAVQAFANAPPGVAAAAAIGVSPAATPEEEVKGNL